MSVGAVPNTAAELLDLVLRHDGDVVTRFRTVVNCASALELEQVLAGAVRRRRGAGESLGDYELELHHIGVDEPFTTYVGPTSGRS